MEEIKAELLHNISIVVNSGDLDDISKASLLISHTCYAHNIDVKEINKLISLLRASREYNHFIERVLTTDSNATRKEIKTKERLDCAIEETKVLALKAIENLFKKT